MGLKGVEIAHVSRVVTGITLFEEVSSCLFCHLEYRVVSEYHQEQSIWS